MMHVQPPLIALLFSNNMYIIFSTEEIRISLPAESSDDYLSLLELGMVLEQLSNNCRGIFIAQSGEN